METGNIQSRISEMISWFEAHIQRTKEAEAESRELLAGSTVFSIDQQLKIGRTCREFRECGVEAANIVHALKTHHGRIGDVHELVAELELSAQKGMEE